MLYSFAGNKTVIDTLSGIIRQNRPPHALIIEGESGTGKRRLKNLISAALLCTAEHTEKPCGGCSECKSALSFIHPDITVIEPAGRSISVDVIRGVRGDAYVLPNQGKRRIFEILEADKMTDQAANALLKVLEEPPHWLTFILVTENASRLLSTIRSRSMIFTLTAPDMMDAVKYIQGLPENYESGKIEKAVNLYHGNIGKSLEYLAIGTESEEREAAGKILALVAANSDLELLRAFLPYEKDRKKAKVLLEELSIKITRQLMLKCGIQQDCAGDASGGEISLTKKSLFKMDEAVKQALTAIDRNAGMALLSTNLCACLKALRGV